MRFPQKSCEAFEEGYFEKHFAPLIALPAGTANAVFLQTLENCDAAIGEQQSLGEKKSLVLLQLLQFLFPSKVYVFCSDDGGARKGVVSIGGVHCLNVLSLFYRLRELGYEKSVAEPYFDAYEAFVTRTGSQTTFKVWRMLSSSQRCRVACRQVFDDIYDGKFRLRKNGDLEYIS